MCDISVQFDAIRLAPNDQRGNRMLMEIRDASRDAEGEKTILFVSNCAWNLANFRRPVIESLVRNGHRVLAAAGPDSAVADLESLGVTFIPVAVDAGGTSPLKDLRLLGALISLMRRVRPDCVMTFTVKPNTYGGIAARLCRIPLVATISGLGTSFLGGGVTARIVDRLYRSAFRTAKVVFFQNAEDRALFIDRALVPAERTALVAGSGIDLDRFNAEVLPPSPPFRFLFIGRLLRDKGVVELADAARLLAEEGRDFTLDLLGSDGGSNPSAIAFDAILRSVGAAKVRRVDAVDDVRPSIAASHCVVLPSYREGLPRSLLEGAAMARPLIATDVTGCRDVVQDGVNGFLCEPRSARDLARAMGAMMDLSEKQRVAIGAAGRALVERSFDQNLVACAYCEALDR